MKVSCRLLLLAAVVLAAIADGAGPALADHETRNQVIADNGISFALVAVVLGAAALALVCFVVVMRWWEDRDSAAGSVGEDDPTRGENAAGVASDSYDRANVRAIAGETRAGASAGDPLESPEELRP